jgi:hypothetical protein
MDHRKEYLCWWNMLDRCLNPQNSVFRYYGGRGIGVCVRWRSFPNFFTDMGPRPRGFSIERVNNDGNYEPSNCLWADRGTQNRNKRKSAVRPRGRPGFNFTQHDMITMKGVWRSRKYQNDAERTVAVRRRSGKKPSRAWLRLTFGSPHKKD